MYAEALAFTFPSNVRSGMMTVRCSGCNARCVVDGSVKHITSYIPKRQPNRNFPYKLRKLSSERFVGSYRSDLRSHNRERISEISGVVKSAVSLSQSIQSAPMIEKTFCSRYSHAVSEKTSGASGLPLFSSCHAIPVKLLYQQF